MEQINIHMVQNDKVMGLIQGGIDITYIRDSITKKKSIEVKAWNDARIFMPYEYRYVVEWDAYNYYPEKFLFDLIIKRKDGDNKLKGLYYSPHNHSLLYCTENTTIAERFILKSF